MTDGPSFGEGTALCIERRDEPEAIHSIEGRNLAATTTIFGLLLSRVFDDPGLYTRLMATWNQLWVQPRWSADSTVLSYETPIVPLLYQNGSALWARVTTEHVTLSTLTQAAYSPAAFDTPAVVSGLRCRTRAHRERDMVAGPDNPGHAQGRTTTGIAYVASQESSSLAHNRAPADYADENKC